MTTLNMVDMLYSAASSAAPKAPLHREHKPRGRISDQQRRRELALERQKAARRDLQAHARRLASEGSITALEEETKQQNVVESGMQEDVALPVTEGSGDGDSEMELTISELDGGRWRRINRDGVPIDEGENDGDVGSKGQQNRSELRRRHIPWEDVQRGLMEDAGGAPTWSQSARDWYSQQLMQPEWMVDVPPNLGREWYVMARPEGKRCLVVSSNGCTVSRLRNGRILHRFPSSLPNGARTRDVAGASHVYCILDCIFHEADQTYYVIDMMCWRGYSLYDCAAEFRFFWVNSKLNETQACAGPSHYHRYRFCPVPIYECTRTGLLTAYSSAVPYQRDGLLLYNRHGHYSLGLTPLVLLWKDAHTSRYFLDTDSAGNVPLHQQIMLELQEDATVATCDEPPVVLGALPPTFLQEHPKLRPGSLLRFSIGDGGLHVVEGRPVTNDLRYEGPGNQRRGLPDSWSKILFQYMARHQPLALADLEASLDDVDGGLDVKMVASNMPAEVPPLLMEIL